MDNISIRGATKTYPEFKLGPIDLDVKDGEFFGIFGPPSSGKTSILRMILGLLKPDEGEVFLNGEPANELEVDARNIAMVFQNLALFPHMTGRENIIFPLVENKFPEKEIEERLDFVSEVLHVSHILHKNPAQMSGGERQRIALGRAFASNSQAMLLDEPIAALDARLREEMRVELKRLQREKNQTFVYVSHDEEEVLAISDRVAVVIDGQIAQTGTPAEVYDTPNTIAVAEVIGSPPMNFFKGTLSEGGKTFSCDEFDASLTLPGLTSEEENVTIGVRPEDFWLVDGTGAGTDAGNGAGKGTGRLSVEVTSSEPLGSYTIVNALLGDKNIKIRAPGQVHFGHGAHALVEIDDRHVHVFDRLGRRV